MKSIMIGAIALAATGLLAGACTTRETRIIQAPAVVGAAPGTTTTTVIRTNRAAPVVIESEDKRDIIVNVD